MDEEEARKYNFWKFVAIALFFLLLGILAGKTVLAADPMKWTICNAVNITGYDCDVFWENFINQYGGEQTNETFYNKTEIDNKLSNIYNKTLVDSFVNALNNSIHILNRSNYTVNTTGFVTLETYNKYREEVNDKYVKKEDIALYTGKTDKTASTNEILIVFAVLLAGVLGFLGYTYMKGKKPEIQQQQEPASVRQEFEELKSEFLQKEKELKEQEERLKKQREDFEAEKKKIK